MQKVLIVLLASLIGMLLCSGVASAAIINSCCAPGFEGESCYCANSLSESHCEDTLDGIWVGENGCDSDPPYAPCDQYCTEGGKCVPEASTIALLATGLICMTGYLRLRRKEE